MEARVRKCASVTPENLVHSVGQLQIKDIKTPILRARNHLLAGCVDVEKRDCLGTYHPSLHTRCERRNKQEMGHLAES